MHRRSIFLVGLGAAGTTAIGMAVAACTLITSRNGLQCQTSQDCWNRGPAFSSTICTSSGTCEPVVAGDAAAASVGCVSSSECEFKLGGVAGRCVSGKCTPLTTGSFCSVTGPASDDSVVLVGILVPQGGVAAAQVSILGQGQLPFFNVVLNDFNTATQTDGGASLKQPPRFAAVVCDESQLPAAIKNFEALQIGIVIGPTSEEALNTVLAKKEFTVISPLGDDSAFASSADPQHRRWFINTNRSSGTKAFADLAASVQRAVAAQRYPPPKPDGGVEAGAEAGAPGPIKLALVYDSVEPNEQDFRAALEPMLKVNGTSAVGSPSYLSLDINFSVTDPSASPAAASEQLLSFAPDVVLLAGPLWTASLIDTLEARWAILNHTASPVYVSWRVLPSMASYAQTYKWPDRKMYALDGYLDSALALNAGVVAARFASAELNVGTNVAAPYALTNYSDALYTAMFGVTAAAKGGTGVGLNATEIAAGLDTVSQGTERVSLVAAQIDTFLGLVQANTQTLMVGSVNYLGFNPMLGIPTPGIGQMTSPFSFTAYCLGTAKGPKPFQWETAGVEYASTDQLATGTLDCR